MNRALVRRPGPRLAAGIVTHIARQPVDVAAAKRQWSAYVEALSANGWQPIEVTPAPDYPDAVFVEDTVVMVGDSAVITRPGAPERRPEIEATEAAVRELGCAVERIAAPGTLDGGDVLKVGKTVYVGRGGRTNDDGIAQLRVIAARHGMVVVPVNVTKVLHLKSAVTALPDGTVIGYPPLVDDPDVFEKFRVVPEESGAHVVLLGENRLLMAADAPQSAELFDSLGYQPVRVDISEFEKLEGCVTCLSVRLRE
jgi:dimethylargininase